MRLLTYSFAVFALFCLSVFARGQDDAAENRQEKVASTLRPIELGIAREDVHRRWGPPTNTNRSLFTAEDLASQEAFQRAWETKGLLRDIYVRKTALNDYRVQLDYEPYESKGGAGAVIRLVTVHLDLTEPRTVLPSLRDMPEALELCRSGCNVHGDRTGGFPSVMVYPQNPTLRHRALADRIMYGWKPVPPGRRGQRKEWIPAVEFRLQEESGDQNRPIHEIAWFERPIKHVSFTMYTPFSDWEEERKTRAFVEGARRYYKNRPQSYENYRRLRRPRLQELSSFNP